MIEVGLEVVCALDRGVRQAGAVPAECLEEGARVAAVLRARALVAGVESSESAVGPEVRAVLQLHKPEHAPADPSFAGFAVSLEQVQLLEPFEYPEGEVDLDAGGIENLSVEIVRQNFACRQLVDFGAPARSRRIKTETIVAAADLPVECTVQSSHQSRPAFQHDNITVFAGCLSCQA